MPNVNFHLHSNEPPRQYPYHLLVTQNYRLPPGMASDFLLFKNSNLTLILNSNFFFIIYYQKQMSIDAI
jgi:hypothetical protein